MCGTLSRSGATWMGADQRAPWSVEKASHPMSFGEPPAGRRSDGQICRLQAQPSGVSVLRGRPGVRRVNTHCRGEPTVQVEYAPYGKPTWLCAALEATPQAIRGKHSASAITTSRAAQPGASGAERGAGITEHHDPDIRIVSKPTRWPGSAKITAVPGGHAAAATWSSLGPRPRVISTDT